MSGSDTFRNRNRSTIHRASGSHAKALPIQKNGRGGSRAAENENRSATKFADRRRRRGRIVIGLTVLCAVEFVIALLTSPALNVRHGRIDGVAQAAGLTQTEVEATKYAAALPKGTNWIAAPIGSIHDRLSALPWIRTASVHRRLPLDVVATVQVRTPAYALVTPVGRFEMDSSDTPIRPLRRLMVSRLKPIVMQDTLPLKLGINPNISTVTTGSQILHLTLRDDNIRIKKIVIDRNSNIWLNMANGLHVKFGHCDAVDAKLTMLRKLLANDISSQFTEINVSNPEWPAGRLREVQKARTDLVIASIPRSGLQTRKTGVAQKRPAAPASFSH